MKGMFILQTAAPSTIGGMPLQQSFSCIPLPSAIIAYNWHLCLTTETYIEVSMQTLHLLIFSRKVCMIDLGVRICMFEPIEILTLYNFNRYL